MPNNLNKIEDKKELTEKLAERIVENKCVYPDWEGGYIIGEHKFGKDGFCIICGEQIKRNKEK